MDLSIHKYFTGLAACFLIAILPAIANPNDNKHPEYNEAQVLERLNAIEDPLVETRFTSVVSNYVKKYLVWGRRGSEEMIGRSVLYYPVIEKQLRQRNLPDKIKYLPIVESALRPHAVSHVGAVGLWQFMPGTATDHGLKVNKYIDERKDLHKSTEAALNYLEREYNKYGSWALALAAYNGGSGRVSRAIKRGRSKDFWKIRRYLPRETRNYVPAYIAATYLMEYYEDHGLEPRYPSLELQITETAKVYQAVSFHRIAQVTGLPLDVIETLNPAYLKAIVPESEEGNYVVLPSRVMPAFREYLYAQRPDTEDAVAFDDTPVIATSEEVVVATDEHYRQGIYLVGPDETLGQVAEKLDCSPHQLLAWNGDATEGLTEGQELVFYVPKSVIRFQPREQFTVAPLLTLSVSGQLSTIRQSSTPLPRPAHWVVVSSKKQSVKDIAEQLPGISYPLLLDYNDWPSDYRVAKGERVLVPVE